MRKILFISVGEFYPFKGGIANYVKELTESLEKTHQLLVLAPYLKGNVCDNLFNFKIIRPRLTRFSYIQKLIFHPLVFCLTKTYKPDIVFITDQLSLSLSIPFLKFFKHKVIFLYGTEILDIAQGKGLVSKQNFKYVLKAVDSIVTISSYTKKLLLTQFPETPLNKIVILYPTITQEFINANVKNEFSVLKKYNVKIQEYIVSIGRLVKRKGHEKVIKLFPTLSKELPSLKYVIIGEGPELNNLKRKARNLRDKIILTGQVTEPEKKVLLKNCCFYIHPSIHSKNIHQRVEGFGISILEAFFLKKTAIINNHGGAKEIVKDGFNGYIVDIENEKQSIEKIVSLFKDLKLRKQLSENAYLTYLQKFSPKIFHQNLKNLIEKIDKKTIAFIVEWDLPIKGGASIQAHRQANLLKKNYNIKFFSKPIPKFLKKLLKNPFVFKIHDYISSFILFLKLVKEKNKIDIIHVHGNLENNFSIAALIFSKIFKKPIIGKIAIAGEFTQHLEYKKTNKIVIFLKKINPLNFIRQHLAKKFDAYICISQDIKKELIEAGVDKAKIFFIPNGININKFAPPDKKKKLKLREKLSLGKNKIIFLVVSRLAAHKGIISPLLVVWKELFGKKDSFLLLLIGSGENLPSSVEHKVKSFIKNSNLTNVKLLGKKENVKEYLQAADVFLLPSENEGLSNALLEAMSTALPCLVSDVSGNKDLIVHNRTGFLFKKGNKLSFKQNLILILNKKDEWEKIGKNARKMVAKNYNINLIIKKLIKLYEKFI